MKMWVLFCEVNKDESGVNFCGVFNDRVLAEVSRDEAAKLYPDYSYFIEEVVVNRCEVKGCVATETGV